MGYNSVRSALLASTLQLPLRNDRLSARLLNRLLLRPTPPPLHLHVVPVDLHSHTAAVGGKFRRITVDKVDESDFRRRDEDDRLDFGSGDGGGGDEPVADGVFSGGRRKGGEEKGGL
jgi:hypothetical protein